MADLRYKVVVDDAEAKRKLADLLKGTGVSGNGSDGKAQAASTDNVTNATKKLKDAQLASIEALRQARIELSQQIKAQSDLNNKYSQGKIDLQTFRFEQAKLNAARKEEARQARETKRALMANSEYSQLASALNTVRNQAKNTLAEMAKLERQGRKNSAAYQDLTQKSRSLVSQTQVLDNQIKRIDATVGQHQRKVGNYGDAIGMVAPQLSMFAGRLGLVAAGVAAVNQSFTSNLRMEPINMALKVGSGNAEQFNRNLEFLRETTDRLGLGFISTSNAFKMWQGAAKFSNLTANETRGIFESVANAGAKMKLSNEQVEGTFLALSQMLSKGKVQAEELRGQLGERLPGAFALAAKAMGVTEQELNKMLEKGEVIADEFLPRFASQLDKSFGNDKSERIQGMQASVNRLENEFDALWQSERASGFFTVVTDGFARMFKDINLMVNSKSWAEFKAIAFGGQAEHAQFVKSQMPAHLRAVDGFGSLTKSEQVKLIKQQQANVDSRASEYNSRKDNENLERLTLANNALAEMNKIYHSQHEIKKKITKADELTDAEKAKAERKAEQARQAVERQRKLQNDIESLANQSTRKQLSRDEEEIASIKDKYAKMREEVRKFYADPKNAGLRVDQGKLKQAESFEISEATTRQGTKELLKQLNEQKSIYDQYNAYVEQNGIDAAERMFGIQADLAKNYRAKLQQEYASINALQGTQAQQERAKELKQMLDSLDREDAAKMRAKYAEALQLAKTFTQKELEIRKKHNEALAALGKYASEEQRRNLELSLVEELATLVESEPAFKKAIDNINDASQAMLADAFKTGKATMLSLIDGMSNASSEEKDSLRKMFTKFFDDGIKDAELGKLTNINDLVGTFDQLVSTSFQFAGNIGNGVDAIRDMLSISGQLVNVLGSLSKNESFSKLAGKIAGSLGIFGAFGGILSSVTSFFAQKRAQEDQQRTAAADSAVKAQLRATEAVTRALEKQVELMNEIYGVERLEKYSSTLSDIEKTWKEVNGQLSGKYMLTGDAKIDEIITKMNNGMTRNEIAKGVSPMSKEMTFIFETYAAIEKGRYGMFSSISGDISKAKEQLIQLERQSYGKVDENTQNIINQLREQIDLYEKTLNKLAEEKTGNAFSSLLSDVTNLFFNEGENSAEAWSKGFDKILENYLMQKFSREFLQERMQGWYNMMNDFAGDGIDASEREQLKKEWDAIQKAGEDRLNQMKDILDLNGSTDNNNTTLKGKISRELTEKTGGEIVGIFRAGYDIWKQQLIAIQAQSSTSVNLLAIASDKLAVLNSININTANTVTELRSAVVELKAINKNTSKTGRSAEGMGL